MSVRAEVRSLESESNKIQNIDFRSQCSCSHYIIAVVASVVAAAVLVMSTLVHI